MCDSIENHFILGSANLTNHKLGGPRCSQIDIENCILFKTKLVCRKRSFDMLSLSK